MNRLPLVAFAVFGLAVHASAQCTNLAVPGLNGCGNFTPFGIPTISCTGSPTVGNAAFAVAANVPCPTTTPLLLVGTCLPSPISITGPFGAGGFCGPSMAPCLAFVGPTIFAGVPAAWVGPGSSSFSFAVPIPNDPTIVGATVCIQETSLCAIVTGGQCIGASQGISVTVI